MWRLSWAAPSVEPMATTADLTVLRDTTSLVTGGASGLGAAVVAELASHGAHVVVVDRTPTRPVSWCSGSSTTAAPQRPWSPTYGTPTA